MQTVRFDIIIPTYNNLTELKQCLASLGEMPHGDFKVWLCVDGSTDGTQDWFKSQSFPFPIRILEHADLKNHGRAATRNLALPFLEAPYSLFLDSDMVCRRELLQAHASVLDQGNTISIGTVSYQNTQGNLWVRYTSERGVAKFEGGAVVPFHYFITPNTAVPTHWLKEVEGFDTQISRYGGEDMELGYRLHLHAHPRFIFNNKAVAVTTQPKMLKDALPQLQEYGATGLRYITRKWPELSNIYWVNKCNSQHPTDRMFEWLTLPTFQKMAWWSLNWMPYGIQKILINYLVIAHIHTGYRTGKTP